MERSKLVKNEETFTSDTETFKLDANNIKLITIGFQALQNGATAPTLADDLAQLAELRVYEGGDIRTLITGADLYALNLMWLGHRPYYLNGGGDNYVVKLSDLWLPLNASSNKEWKMFIDYSSNSDVDTEKITVGVHYVESGLGRGLAFNYLSDSASADFAWKDMSKAGWNLRGLLLYATTIPSTTSDNYTIKEVKMKVNTVEISHYHWEELNERTTVTGDTTEEAILANYKLILFDELLPADNLKVGIKGDGATDTYRLVGIYI